MTAKREFFTTNEVAQTLGISPFTIRRYIRLRMLKAVKLEGSYRVRRTDLNRFLKAREVETEEELDALDAAEEPATTVPKKRAATQAETTVSNESGAEQDDSAPAPEQDAPAPERAARPRRKQARSQSAAEPASPSKKPARKPVKRTST